MKKLLAGVLIFITIFFSGGSAVSAVTVDELQAQINDLLQQLSVLQGQASSGGQSSSAAVSSQSSFSRNLFFGLKNDPEVIRLQALLGVDQTGNFGPLTQAAVQTFQATHGIDTTGYVGPQTRAALGLKVVDDTETVTSGPVAPITTVAPRTAVSTNTPGYIEGMTITKKFGPLPCVANGGSLNATFAPGQPFCMYLHFYNQRGEKAEKLSVGLVSDAVFSFNFNGNPTQPVDIDDYLQGDINIIASVMPNAKPGTYANISPIVFYTKCAFFSSCGAAGSMPIWIPPVGIGSVTSIQPLLFSLMVARAGYVPHSGSVAGSITIQDPSAPALTSVPVVTLTLDKNTAAVGDKPILTWKAINSPTYCSSTGNGPGWGGAGNTNLGSDGTTGATVTSLPTFTSAGTFTYTMVCTNASGSSVPVSASVIVGQVTNNNPVVPVVTLTLDKSTAIVGDKPVLTWKAANSPTYCSSTGNAPGWGGAGNTNLRSDGTTGATVTSLPAFTSVGTFTYTMTCSNASGSSVPATATVTVSNGSVGNGNTAPSVTLTAYPASISAGLSSMLTWSSNGANCDGTGFNTSTKAGGSVVVQPSQTTTYSISCTNSIGGTPTVQNATVTVAGSPVLPATLAAFSFTASPMAITAGQSSTLTWSSTPAAGTTVSCTLANSNGNINQGTSIASSGSTTISPAVLTVYRVSCMGSNGQGKSQDIAVSVQQTAPTISFTANPASLPAGGGTTWLSWNATSASSCSIANLYNSNGGATGSVPVSPAFTTVYTINCNGLGGPSSANVTVTVAPPAGSTVVTPSVKLSGVPASVAPGTLSTLHIDVTGVQSCEIYGNGAVISGGARYTYAPGSYLAVFPTQTTTYSATCWDKGGQTVSGSTSITVPNTSNVFDAMRTLLEELARQASQLR
ncbi:MAG: hypothetical protein JWN89_341 [Parcubacteria group bacterium]|nr:hypothetical protein [Parcubacteria group bacterium]